MTSNPGFRTTARENLNGRPLEVVLDPEFEVIPGFSQQPARNPTEQQRFSCVLATLTI